MMTEFNFKKAVLTIGLSVCFSLIGCVIMKTVKVGEFGFFFTLPFLFGISIPLANLRDVGLLKIPKLLFAGLLSAGLLYVAILLSTSGLEFNMYLIAGLNSAALLWVYSQVIDTVQPTFKHYLLVIVLCIFAIGLSLRSPDSNGVPDLYFTMLLWTSFFTVGLTTSLKVKNTAPNTLNVPLSNSD
jgi:hypothetical protein